MYELSHEYYIVYLKVLAGLKRIIQQRLARDRMLRPDRIQISLKTTAM